MDEPYVTLFIDFYWNNTELLEANFDQLEIGCDEQICTETGMLNCV